MENKKLNVLVNKSGNGSLNFRAPLPAKWARDIGLSEGDRDIEICFDEEKQEIIIRKAHND